MADMNIGYGEGGEWVCLPVKRGRLSWWSATTAKGTGTRSSGSPTATRLGVVLVGVVLVVPVVLLVVPLDVLLLLLVEVMLVGKGGTWQVTREGPIETARTKTRGYCTNPKPDPIPAPIPTPNPAPDTAPPNTHSNMDRLLVKLPATRRVLIVGKSFPCTVIRLPWPSPCPWADVEGVMGVEGVEGVAVVLTLALLLLLPV